jgi:hypothetical protein
MSPDEALHTRHADVDVDHAALTILRGLYGRRDQLLDRVILGRRYTGAAR